MRTHRGLFARLVDADELEEAARLAIRGKRRRPAVAGFLLRGMSDLEPLRQELLAGRWRPGPSRLLWIHAPKPRVIAVSPLRDRILHRALTRVLCPVFEPSLSECAFACVPGRGTHRARLRLLEAVRRFESFLHLDVRAYFPSVRHNVALGLLGRRVRDRAFLDVCEAALAPGIGLYDRPRLRRHLGLGAEWPPPSTPAEPRGLPIGAGLSQFLAGHVVLAELDHLVKREWHVPGYLRYVDDLFLFSDSRGELGRCREDLVRWLATERDLRLKAPLARVRSCRGTLDGLGVRIRRRGILPRPRAVRQLESFVRREVGRPVHGGGRRVDVGASLESRVEGLFPG